MLDLGDEYWLCRVGRVNTKFLVRERVCDDFLVKVRYSTLVPVLVEAVIAVGMTGNQNFRPVLSGPYSSDSLSYIHVAGATDPYNALDGIRHGRQPKCTGVLQRGA